MAKSVRCCLVEALEDLTKTELENFKANLNEFPVKEGFRNIPRGPLEKAGALQVSDLLVSYYNQDYAVEVAAKVLSDILNFRKVLKSPENFSAFFAGILISLSKHWL
uniref:Pyrin domain-containing protein n=1 Tax=Naja naja TaxID=35670 RepID=A0A8C7E4I2_NAJNA